MSFHLETSFPSRHTAKVPAARSIRMVMRARERERNWGGICALPIMSWPWFMEWVRRMRLWGLRSRAMPS